MIPLDLQERERFVPKGRVVRGVENDRRTPRISLYLIAAMILFFLRPSPLPAAAPTSGEIILETEVKEAGPGVPLLRGMGVPQGQAARWGAALPKVFAGSRLRAVLSAKGRLVEIYISPDGLFWSRFIPEENRWMRRGGAELLESDFVRIVGRLTPRDPASLVHRGVPLFWTREISNLLHRALRGRTIPPTHRVAVLFQQLTDPRTGKHYWGRPVALRMTTPKAIYEFYYFSDPLERGSYFDPEGWKVSPIRFLSPLRRRVVTSGFSEARLHPVLGRILPHHGLDLAAAEGTPVMAAADGTILSAGWRGGFGRCLVLEHDEGYATLYGHLSRFAPKSQPGRRVRSGEVIGYVGSTGLATGPHLHFALSFHGAMINPLELETGARIDPDRLLDFRIRRDQYRQKLDPPAVQIAGSEEEEVNNPHG